MSWPRPIDPADVHDAVPRPDPILSVGNASPYTIDGVTYEVLDNHKGYRMRGIASWYGAKFHGHETSNGEIYDLYQASAARSRAAACLGNRMLNVFTIANGRLVQQEIALYLPQRRGPSWPGHLLELREREFGSTPS